MKDEIFGKARYGGMSFNTQGLERLLKEEFTETKCMDDESYPRYVKTSRTTQRVLWIAIVPLNF